MHVALRSFAKNDTINLDADLAAALKKLFEKMDQNSDGTITKSEAITFWGKNFAKVCAQRRFRARCSAPDEKVMCMSVAIR